MQFGPHSIFILMLSGLHFINCQSIAKDSPTTFQSSNKTSNPGSANTPSTPSTPGPVSNMVTSPANTNSTSTKGLTSNATMSPANNATTSTSVQATNTAKVTKDQTKATSSSPGQATNTAKVTQRETNATSSSPGQITNTVASQNNGTTRAPHNKTTRIAVFPTSSFFGFALLAVSVLCL